MLDALWPSLRHALEVNQFLSGGAVLMAFGAIVASLRGVPAFAFEQLKDRWVLSLEVTSQDAAYGWFKHWIDGHPANLRIRRLLLGTFAVEGDSASARRVMLTPAPGTHFLRHRGRWWWVTIQRADGKDVQVNVAGENRFETLTLQTLGGDRALIHALVAEAREAGRVASKPGVRVHVFTWMEWKLIDIRTPKSPEAIVLAGDTFERLSGDVQSFLASRDWYQRLGIPWKRGYLLHGQPGNGKTSLVLAIASLLATDVYCLNLANPDLTDERLVYELSEVPRGAIVLLEEVDTLFDGRKRPADGDTAKVSFAGLLNALDGIASAEGRILFMTTNHLEKLDPALIRPGRADVHLHLGHANGDQVARLFRRFYPQAPAHAAERMAERLPEGSASMAAWQEHFMRHRDDAEAAIAQAGALLAADAFESAP